MPPLLFKFVGVAFLLGGGAYGAYLELTTDKARLHRLDSLITLVKYIRSKIDRYLTPIGEILRQCDSEIIDGCFLGVSEELSTRPSDVSELVLFLRKGEYFEDGKEAICLLADNLGRSYREESVRECDECLKELCALREKLANELPKKRKARAVIGLCAAAATVIVII